MENEEVFIPYAVLTPELKELVDSPDWNIRRNAASRGLGLDKLIDDPHPSVRAAVAIKEYGLDRLVNDPDAYVRFAVAEQGYSLETLINDPSALVRGCVACQGYGLDKLINDPDLAVQQEAQFYLYGHDLGLNGLKEWILNNTDKCVLPENRNLSKEAIAREKEQLRIVAAIDESYDPVPAHPSYTTEELLRMLSERDDVAYVTYWTREDIVNEVESLGFDPNTPGLFEAVSEEFASALEDASESFAILDDIIRDKAAGIAPGELLPEIQCDMMSNKATGKSERATSFEELAARGTAKAEEHNKTLRSRDQPSLGKRVR